jgi:6-phosphofructokinase 2
MKILSIALNPTIDISSDADRIEPTHKMRTTNQRWHAGGGGVNVARVIGKLGGRSELLIFSGGAAGLLLQQALSALPIDVHALPVGGETRIAFVVYEKETGLEYRFVPEGPEITDEELEQALDVVRNFQGEYVIASGSLPRGVPDNIYAKMAQIAATNGARFVLDTSGKPLASTLNEAQIFLVKPSRHELETLAGQPLDDAGLVETAMQLVRSGHAQYVALTLGDQGAMLVSAKGILRLPAIHVRAKSAVGAGDSFVAALIWHLSQGYEIEEAFRFGIAAGAAAAMTPGTELCRREDVLAMFEASTPVSESLSLPNMT